MNNDELNEELVSLSEYYTEVAGRVIDLGSEGGDIWISSSRTSGREYFNTLDEAEERIHQLYEEYFLDDGEVDSLDDL
jgi:hypothetical protein